MADTSELASENERIRSYESINFFDNRLDGSQFWRSFLDLQNRQPLLCDRKDLQQNQGPQISPNPDLPLQTAPAERTMPWTGGDLSPSVGDKISIVNSVGDFNYNMNVDRAIENLDKAAEKLAGHLEGSCSLLEPGCKAKCLSDCGVDVIPTWSLQMPTVDPSRSWNTYTLPRTNIIYENATFRCVSVVCFVEYSRKFHFD